MVNHARSTSSLQVKSSHTSTKKTSRSRTDIEQTDSKTNGIPTEDAQNNDDDCFVQWGVTSSSEVKNRRTTNRIPKQKNVKTQPEDSAEGEQAATQDQPAHLVEEIDAIIALIIYNTYSKKHEMTFSPQHRGKRARLPHPIRDDIDRFDGLYTCLTEETVREKNRATSGNRLNDYLRQRFFSLSNINELRNFQQSEFLRTFDEKRINQARVPFVPNLLASQRTCTTDQVEDLIWIRDHLC